jgi:hypothetical protein
MHNNTLGDSIQFHLLHSPRTLQPQNLLVKFTVFHPAS